MIRNLKGTLDTCYSCKFKIECGAEDGEDWVCDDGTKEADWLRSLYIKDNGRYPNIRKLNKDEFEKMIEVKLKLNSVDSWTTCERFERKEPLENRS